MTASGDTLAVQRRNDYSIIDIFMAGGALEVVFEDVIHSLRSPISAHGSAPQHRQRQLCSTTFHQLRGCCNHGANRKQAAIQQQESPIKIVVVVVGLVVVRNG